MPTLSSHPQVPVHNFSAHLLGRLGELPVAWRPVASPRSNAARRPAREARRYLACGENAPSRHKHSGSSPCPPTLLNNSQNIPTPPSDRPALSSISQNLYTAYGYNNDT